MYRLLNGGEWMAEQQGRLVSEIEALCGLHKDKDVIACVGHADPIKLIVAYYLGLPLDMFQGNDPSRKEGFDFTREHPGDV